MGNGLKSCKQQHTSSTLISTPLLEENNENLRVFSVKELKKATKGFKKERVIEGELGAVRTFYKGSITFTPSKTKTAVSVMQCIQYDVEAREAWKEEVASVGKYSHPNIVKFLGYCCEDTKSLLVFEYLHQGTLDHLIYGKKEVLSWAKRIKIAIGISQGVAFIHSISNSSLYFELRLHNIMLDEEYNAKLFYLETNKKRLEDQARVLVGREYIYIPYESMMTGIFGMDTDVHAFGVILSELFTGSKDVAEGLRGKSLDVVNNEIIDPRLKGDYPVTAAMEIGTLIQRCTEDNKTRPSMQQVLDVLNHIAEIH